MLSEEARAALCGRPGNKTIDPALDVSIISSDCSHMAKACVNMLGIGGITLDAEIKHTIKVEYGGSFENLPQDIIDRIRAACARPHSQHEGASFGKVAELLNAIVGGTLRRSEHCCGRLTLCYGRSLVIRIMRVVTRP